MKNIKFFDSDKEGFKEEVFDLPMDDFTDELTIAKARYGYVDSYYDDCYEQTLVIPGLTAGFVEIGNNSNIFLNPKLVREENIAEVIAHESIHIVIRKFVKNSNSELVIRKLLNQPLGLSRLDLVR